VANTLSIGFKARRWSQYSAGNSWKAIKALVPFVRLTTPRAYLAPYFSLKASMAASAARVAACEISRRSAVTAGCTDLGID